MLPLSPSVPFLHRAERFIGGAKIKRRRPLGPAAPREYTV